MVSCEDKRPIQLIGSRFRYGDDSVESEKAMRKDQDKLISSFKISDRSPQSSAVPAIFEEQKH